MVRSPPAYAGHLRDTCCEDPFEREMAAHSSILAWRIPWTEEPRATVHRVANNQTRLKRLSTHAHINILLSSMHANKFNIFTFIVISNAFELIFTTFSVFYLP